MKGSLLGVPKLKNQHTFGGSQIRDLNNSQISMKNRQLEITDIFINVTEKLSILDKCLLSVFSKRELRDIYECKQLFSIDQECVYVEFPYLVNMNFDAGEVSKFNFARE